MSSSRPARAPRQQPDQNGRLDDARPGPLAAAQGQHRGDDLATIETVHVRFATPGDERGLAAVHVRTWQVAYRGQLPDAYLDALSVDARTDLWRRILSASSWPVPTTLVLEHEGKLVGFAHILASRDDDASPEVGELSAIYLIPEHWGEGWGKALLEESTAALQRAGFSTATLWVLESNLRARRFYEAAGWAPDGTTKLDDRGAFVLPEVRYARRLG